jgi:alkylation response protein AidB-like acyl-CoA dehydrogenase
MANFFKDNPDLQFYFDKGIDWDALVKITEHHGKARDAFKETKDAVDFYKSIAETVGEFVAEEIAPYALEIDKQPPVLKDGEAVYPPRLTQIFQRIKEMELHGLCVPRELGGMNSPLILYFITAEMIARADVSAMTHHGFHGGMAMAMLVFSINEGTTEFDQEKSEITKTRWKPYIEEIVRGDAWGCMDITEPNAGSDMARLRTFAEQDADGNWFVTGQKIFITSGHGKYHFVIARTEKAGAEDDAFAGLKGLSMFLVPTYTEDENGRHRHVALDRLEEKMGSHGSVTAALNFDRAPADLIGNRGDGFKYMLTLMNNARLGVGYESIGLCEAAYRKAKQYASERESMGKTIDHHEMIADMLDEMENDIHAIRALCMYGAFHEEMAHKIGLAMRYLHAAGSEKAKHLEKEQKKHAKKSRRVTPLLKYLASEKAVEMCRRSIQIHGGMGYIQETGVEKLLRDAMVMPIYEGTSQIQSLMAMKDCLGGIMKNPRRFLAKQASAHWSSLSANDPLEKRVAKIQVQSLSAQNHLLTKTAAAKLRGLPDKPMATWITELSKNWDPKRDFAFAMLHAERLTRILADEAICELLLEQSQQFPERREILEKYLDRCEPRVRFLHDEMTTTGARILKQLGRTGEAPAPAKAANG